MEAKVDPLASPYVNLNKFQGDEGKVVDVDVGGGVVLQQQWVTMTASMWPEPTSPSTSRGWRLSVTGDRLPLLAAVFCGAALVVCLLAAFLLYRCCVMPRREKHYCLRKVDGGGSGTQVPSNVVSPGYQNQAAVFAEHKGSGWGYSNRLVAPAPVSPWYVNKVIGGPHCTQCPGICPVPRSTSHPGSSTQIHSTTTVANTSSTRKPRPVSQPIPTHIQANGEIVPKSPLPEISEFSPQGAQYASSSILDEVGVKDEDTMGEPTLKTRSLPAWVRSKPRPLSTEDDLNDLYAKVNFSKKRKNRMRNDEAAIIALSKSRSQFLHKDTDSLVDNEAVIVYDERTAL
ncbi:uncharacterized protein LOC109599662 isoform X2 [Aethina tumida]|uniref:uncharacterized protein LOC109599662 isoform X2 n=1 Tax=Aethina tumida TaxID=116153 RepID=UPI00096AFC8C|nr:uncharacterized protein LOC109599662 isoform X2 [Aethina tumida]